LGCKLGGKNPGVFLQGFLGGFFHGFFLLIPSVIKATSYGRKSLTRKLFFSKKNRPDGPKPLLMGPKNVKVDPKSWENFLEGVPRPINLANLLASRGGGFFFPGPEKKGGWVEL
jgi:hypothetical protein